MKDFENLCELLAFQASNFKNKTALNFKENGELISFSNEEFLQKSLEFACGLREIGFEAGQTFANYSYQNPIWLIVDFGILLAGGVSVPIFQNISKENLIFEITDANVNFIFTDNKNCLEILGEKANDLKIITRKFSAKNCHEFEEILELGKKATKAKKYSLADFLSKISKSNLATIIYTSGSTGKPKGVELTHQNLVVQIEGSKQFFPLNDSEKVLSFLPLAHIFERMVMMYYISTGVSIYFADDVKNVGPLLREIAPNLFTTVPRVLEKVYANIRLNIESANFLKKLLGKAAIKRALEKQVVNFKNNKKSSLLQSFFYKIIDKFFDILVYRKFRAALGGKVRMIICGGSALSPMLEKFFWNIGVKIYCGYGLTESSPVLAANCPSAYKLGTVGKPFPGVSLKISNDRELLAMGENIMRGYHGSKNSSENFVEGWLKTGDEAQIDEHGFVKITGRIREIFKNSYGKFVNPGPIEQKLTQELSFLQGAVVIAQNRSYGTALLFFDFENLKKFQENFFKIQIDYNPEISASDLSLIIKIQEFSSKIIQQTYQENGAFNQQLIDFIADRVMKINQELDHWQQLKKVALISKQISIESGEITPSMKLKRKVIEEKFSSEIAKLYQD